MRRVASPTRSQHRGAEGGQREQRGEQHDRAVEVRRTCATWPFLRASSRFLGVAFSVLSSPAISATWRVWRAVATERCSSSESQPAANGSDAPTSSRPTATLAGKPTAKTLICGTTRETTPSAASVMISASRTGAQTWIGGDEDAAERELRALDERADLRRLEQRHRLVGAREPGDHPGVAADRDEDQHADHRVELREAATTACPLTRVDERRRRRSRSSVSSSAPAADSAANSAAIPNANAMPDEHLLEHQAASPSASAGIRPSPAPCRRERARCRSRARAATTSRARAGSVLDENSGASRNSGAIAREHEREAPAPAARRTARGGRRRAFIRRRPAPGSSE